MSMGVRATMQSAIVLLASACIFVASCSRSNPPPSPVAADALDRLLLSPAEINTVVGATGIVVIGTSADMSDDSASIPDKDCRFVYSAESSVYDGSGLTGVRSQYLHEPGDDFDHEVRQAVVSFPSAGDAARFFSVSDQRWPACSNRQWHYIEPGQPDKVWTVSPVANANGYLSTTDTLQGASGWACRRALTVSNNVAIDITACSSNPAYGTVFDIGDRIAAKLK